MQQSSGEIEHLYKRIARIKRLAQKYKRSEIIQKALLDISNLAARVECTEAFYAGIQASLNRLLPADNFFIALLNRQTKQLEIPFLADEKDPLLRQKYSPKELSAMLSSGLTGYVLRTQKPLLCDTTTFEHLLAQQAISRQGSCCHQWLGVPISLNEQAIGVIAIQSYDPSINYKMIEVELITFISQHIAGVIARVQYQQNLEADIAHRTQELSVAYDSLKREMAERKRTEQLQNSLFKIADLSNSNVSQHEFYRQLHGIIGELLPVDNCFIALLDACGCRLHFPFYVSQHNAFTPQPRPLTDGLTEFTLRGQQPQLLNAVEISNLIETKQIYAKAPYLNETANIQQWLGVPLLIQGKVKGVLAIYRFSPSQDYHQKDLYLLTFISQHIATAIERKLAAASLQQSYEQLEDKVAQRTRALANLNRELEAEIERRCNIERQLKHDANHDHLTSLPNRTLFMERLNQAVKHIRRHALERFALLFIDLDRFKLLNDTLGHLQGDQFLIETARRLALCIRDNDTLARIGGDEFVILLDGIKQRTDATEVAERVLGKLAAPYHLAQQQFTSSASIGITFSGRNKKDTCESLLKEADAAMYQAKSKGKSCYVIFNHDTAHQHNHDVALEAALRAALANQQLSLHYFPVMRLDNQELLALEPRLYWQHANQGRITQRQLDNIAEHCQLTKELDLYLLAQLDRDYPRLMACSRHMPLLHIKLSSQHLKYKHALRQLKNRIKHSSIPPGSLWVFFNEKAFAQNSENHIQAFEMLTRLSIKVGLSGYGSAHTPLSNLSFLPLSGIKLDADSIRQIDQPQHQKLLGAHQVMISALALSLFAEDIQTHRQRRQLIALGFQAGQGAVFGHPIELDSPELSLREPDWLSA